jgi:hypothetical protein
MEEIKKRLFETIDGLKDKVIRIRRDIHKHPELSGHEEHTKYLVKGILEIEGFDIKEFEGHHGLVADLVTDKKKPFVAIRADMDALPIQEQTGKPYASEVKGVMHACGHDAHTAIGVGTAIAFASVPLGCGFLVVFSAMALQVAASYVSGFLIGLISGSDRGTRVALSYFMGMKNNGAALVMALSSFPLSSTLPVALTIMCQQPMASVLDRVWRRDEREPIGDTDA